MLLVAKANTEVLCEAGIWKYSYLTYGMIFDMYKNSMLLRVFHNIWASYILLPNHMSENHRPCLVGSSLTLERLFLLG